MLDKAGSEDLNSTGRASSSVLLMGGNGCFLSREALELVLLRREAGRLILLLHLLEYSVHFSIFLRLSSNIVRLFSKLSNLLWLSSGNEGGFVTREI